MEVGVEGRRRRGGRRGAFSQRGEASSSSRCPPLICVLTTPDGQSSLTPLADCRFHLRHFAALPACRADRARAGGVAEEVCVCVCWGGGGWGKAGLP